MVRFVVALLFCSLALNASAQSSIAHRRDRSRELVANGGFESYTGTQDDSTDDAFTGWTEDHYSGSYCDSTATARSGNAAVKFRRGTTGFETQFQQGVLLATVSPGQNLRLSFWQRGDGSANTGKFAVYDVSNSAYIFDLTVGDRGSIISTTTYAEVVKAFVAPAGCTSIRVYFYMNNSFNDNTMYVDDASIRR